MKYRLKDVINSLDYNELVKIKEDIRNGGFYLKNFIDENMKERKKLDEKQCATCFGDLKSSANSMTLLFGPRDFKKKASFCESDCLEYFLNELKQMKRVVD